MEVAEIESIRVIDIKKAAELLDRKCSGLYHAVREGRIPGAMKVGGRWRIRVSALRAWMDRGCPPVRA